MRRIIAFFLTVLVAAGLGLGAGYVVLRGEEAVPVKAAPATVTVETGSVGRSLSFGASVDVDSTTLATNVLPGVVTFVAEDQVFSAGQTLYEVGGLPVGVVDGDVPFYRDLSRGMTGADVKQLNAYLNALGYPGAVDSDFGPIAEKNVRQWQKDTGQPVTGTVQLGQLVASPSLPAEAQVRLTNGEHEWSGVVGETRKNEESFTYEVEIQGVGGGTVCDDDCEGLTPGSELQAIIEIVPQVSGPLVPCSAIMTDALGATYVVDAAGERHDVVVLGASQGVAVVDGIDVGSEIRVFGEGD
ncbi:peptidoglycan-binding domain-containing protein [Trueperella bernardiae]|uniref:peptidoglycan-binding domain-containing protein n=1 Tax=Trueperella bernardiae TaxID=59561 RepID=UPI00288A261D|nr:peptidoglycan-binding domain-containing protein [Trueperella bernardiae]